MAKWGEGDPRWIVEEREDAKNVNNWHWSEKNATQWSKDTIKKLLVGLIIDDTEFYFEITEISKLDGEATANNRKGKVIVFYEWDLEAQWKGQLKSEDSKYDLKGKIQVPNLSEENDAEELDVSVTTEKNSVSANKLKDLIRHKVSKLVREKLGKYIIDLKTEYSKDLILPTKKENNNDTTTIKSNSFKESINEVVLSKEERKTDAFNVNGRIDLESEFLCTPYDLYQVLLTKDLVSAFSRSPATVDAVVNGNFSMFGETVAGVFVELVCPTTIKMRWRHQSWAAGHFSDVNISLRATDSGTVLSLTQTGIPEKEVTITKDGWRQRYFHAIKMTFGYGGRMF